MSAVSCKCTAKVNGQIRAERTIDPVGFSGWLSKVIGTNGGEGLIVEVTDIKEGKKARPTKDAPASPPAASAPVAADSAGSATVAASGVGKSKPGAR